MLAVLAGVGALFAFVYPKTLGDFVYSIGLNSYASKLYERDYEKSKDLNSLYSALNLSIKTNDNKKVITLFEKFYSDNEYYKFVHFINQQNLSLEEEPLIKASLLNEDNYLKNKYVEALIKENNEDKAFLFALNDDLNLQPEYNNLGNFLYANFLNTESILKNKFNVVLNNRTTTLLSDFYVCFNNLCDEFEQQYNNVEVYYIVSVGNRAQLIGNTINTILVSLGQQSDAEITAALSEINDNLGTKLMQ